MVAPIDPTHVEHGGVNQDSLNRHCRQGLGHENASMDTSERMESEQQSSFSSSHPSHT